MIRILSKSVIMDATILVLQSHHSPMLRNRIKS